jgi:hypothetical protein
VGISLSQGFTQHLAPLFITIKEHILLARKVVKDRHSPDIGGSRDLVHRHIFEASLQEEAVGS